MTLRGFKLVYCAVVLAFLGSISAQDTSADTCGEGCNCRFNNIQVLDRYIEMKVARAVAEANCKSETSAIVAIYSLMILSYPQTRLV
jgi:hypothetical protein